MRDNRAETWLNQMGVQWSYAESIPLASINEGASRNNQGRLSDRLHPDVVSLYAESMKNGAQFPAILVAETKAQGRVIVSGNHRVAAAQEIGRSDFDAYLITCDDIAVLETITRAANSWEGFGVAKDERITQAKYLLRKYKNLTRVEVARLFGLPASTLNDAIVVDEVREKLACAGIKVEQLSPRHIRQIASLRNTNIMSAFAEMVIDHHLKSHELQPFLSDVRSADTEPEALRRVSLIDVALPKAGRKVIGKRKSNLFRANLQYFAKATNPAVLFAAGFTTQQDLAMLRADTEKTFQSFLEVIDAAQRQIKNTL